MPSTNCPNVAVAQLLRLASAVISDSHGHAA